MTTQIVLTTGIYDLIKDHLRRKKVTKAEEDVLTIELRHAKQVLRRELPEEVVTLERRVTIKDHNTNEEEVYTLVAPAKAKPRKKTHSIISDMGLALVGYKVGDVITWPFKEEERKIEIMKVEALA